GHLRQIGDADSPNRALDRQEQIIAAAYRLDASDRQSTLMWRKWLRIGSDWIHSQRKLQKILRPITIGISSEADDTGIGHTRKIACDPILEYVGVQIHEQIQVL